MILTIKNDKDEIKEYSFSATMKKIVAMNKKLKVKNLRDSFFRALNNETVLICLYFILISSKW